MTAAVVALLLAGAVVVVAVPARAPCLRHRRRGGHGGAPWRPHRPRRPRRRRELDLGVLVTEVATRLRTGSDVEGAWARTLARAGLPAERGGSPLLLDDGVPAPLLDLGCRRRRGPLGVLGGQGARGTAGRGGRARLGPTSDGALPGTLAACRLTHEIGAPLAEVLERCAAGITEAGHARAARAVALAGPRATARLLGWLPLIGLGLGAAVGADPLDVLLSGGLGSACLVLGVVLMLAGRWWVSTLVRVAGAAGTPSPRRRGGRR